MMQKVGNVGWERFAADLKHLNLKFPVKEVAAATGYGPPNVSEFINNKKPIPVEFYEKFYDYFKIKPGIGGKTIIDTVVDAPVTAREFIDHLKATNDRYLSIIEKFGPSLASIVEGQDELVSFVKAAVEREVDRVVNENPKKKEVEMDKINRYSARNLKALRKGTPAGS